MKKATTYKAIIGCVIALLSNAMIAQNNNADSEINQDTYKKLKALGYSDKEVFEDLGNAYFLTENYSQAAFWYDELIKISPDGVLKPSYQERYNYAKKEVNQAMSFSNMDKKDWLSVVKADYQLKNMTTKEKKSSSSSEKFKELVFEPSNSQFVIKEEEPVAIQNFIGKTSMESKEYDAPIAVTANGRTAYFSKVDFVKPLYGMFSKKEQIYKIYKAEKVNGEWTNFEKVAVCPKNYSAKHPAVSADGKRLFFASNMPGSFGDYDIYVADLYQDGSVGVSKNLGQKVNTKKNDLYPSLADGNTLFFASEGRKGHGGLDIYMTQVGQSKVNLAMNMGSPINSNKDDFSISFKDEGGFVMSNRGGDSNIQKVAFTPTNNKDQELDERQKYNSMETIRKSWQVDYSTSVYEDE